MEQRLYAMRTSAQCGIAFKQFDTRVSKRNQWHDEFYFHDYIHIWIFIYLISTNVLTDKKKYYIKTK